MYTLGSVSIAVIVCIAPQIGHKVKYLQMDTKGELDMTNGFTIQSQGFGKSGCLKVLCPSVEFHSLSSL